MFLELLLRKANDLVASGLKLNTRKTYSSAQLQFVRFCNMYGISPYNVPEQVLLMYIAYMNERHLKHSTMLVYLAAVRSLHIQAGLGDPLEGCLRVNLALKAVQRGCAPPKRKLPITRDILLSMGSILSNTFDHRMLWSAFNLAYFGLLRAAEFCVTNPPFSPKLNLTTSDVKLFSEPPPSYMSVHIKQSKTDTASKGVYLYIGCSGHALCAVCSLKHYMDCTPVHENSADMPLFRFQDGQVLTRQLLVLHLHKFLNAIGIDPSQYSGHSFRAGGATDCALSGMGDWEIKLAGRWTSDAYQRYVRAPPSLLVSFASRMLQKTLPSPPLPLNY
jgi:hypothetical protein